MPPSRPVDGASEDYPLTLLTGGILNHFGTGTRSSRSSRLSKFSPQAFLEIGASDAKKLNIGHEDRIKVVSPVAELTTTARIADTLPQGTVFLPNSFPDTPATSLFRISLDPETKAPSLKACRVRLERVEPHEQSEGKAKG